MIKSQNKLHSIVSRSNKLINLISNESSSRNISSSSSSSSNKISQKSSFKRDGPNNRLLKKSENVLTRKLIIFKLNVEARHESTKSLDWLIPPERRSEMENEHLKLNRKHEVGGTFYHEKIVMGYSKEKMCDLVFNVADYKKFVPFCADSQILKDDAQIKMREKKLNLLNLDSKKNLNLKNKSTNLEKDLISPKTIKARLEIGYPPIKESYISHVTMIRPQLVTAISRDTHLFEYLINEWKFHPYTVDTHIKHGTFHSLKLNLTDAEISKLDADINTSDCCIVEFYVSFKFRSKFYSTFTEMFMDKIFKKMIAAFMNRAKQVYGNPVNVPQIPN